MTLRAARGEECLKEWVAAHAPGDSPSRALALTAEASGPLAHAVPLDPRRPRNHAPVRLFQEVCAPLAGMPPPAGAQCQAREAAGALLPLERLRTPWVGKKTIAFHRL